MPERVDFVCHNYDETPYIKDVEHAKHGANPSDIEYYISEPEPKRPKDFGSKMDSTKFKRALLHFATMTSK